MSASVLQQFDREYRLERRLLRHGVQPLDGLSTTEQRREAARSGILANGLAGVICGRNRAGKPVTYAEAFEIAYGVALEAAPPTAQTEPTVQTPAPSHHQEKLL